LRISTPWLRPAKADVWDEKATRLRYLRPASMSAWVRQEHPTPANHRLRPTTKTAVRSGCDSAATGNGEAVI